MIGWLVGWLLVVVVAAVDVVVVVVVCCCCCCCCCGLLMLLMLLMMLQPFLPCGVGSGGTDTSLACVGLDAAILCLCNSPLIVPVCMCCFRPTIQPLTTWRSATTALEASVSAATSVISRNSPSQPHPTSNLPALSPFPPPPFPRLPPRTSLVLFCEPKITASMADPYTLMPGLRLQRGGEAVVQGVEGSVPPPALPPRAPTQPGGASQGRSMIPDVIWLA